MKSIFWYLAQLVHNAVAHPLMGLFRTRWSIRFHDYTADLMSRYEDKRDNTDGKQVEDIFRLMD